MAYQYGIETRSGNRSGDQNMGIYTRTLFGDSIHENPVPVWTADRSRKPFVAFQDPGTKKVIGFSKELFSYGFLTLADPGGGKTNLLNMISSRLLATQESNDKLIFFDTKGDYLREFGGRIPEQERIVIGTGEEYREMTGIPNIFRELMPRGRDGRLVYVPDSDTAAVEAAKGLAAKMDSEQQPVFPAMAAQMIAGGLIYFMRAYWRADPSKLNNRDFLLFMLGRREELKRAFELDYMSDYRSCLDYISGQGNQTQGVNSYIGTILREVFAGPFAGQDPKRECSMREVIEEPGKKTVFIEYDLRWGELLEPMDGFLVDSALSGALGGRRTDRSSVYFILDEMLLLPKLRHLSNGLNFGRSQGVKLLCGLQNVSGLCDVYGEAGAKRILASFQNIVAFCNGDWDTRRFLMERMGGNYQNVSYSALQENKDLQREGHTVEDWDVLSLKLGEAIVSLKGEKPFFFTMPKYC